MYTWRARTGGGDQMCQKIIISLWDVYTCVYVYVCVRANIHVHIRILIYESWDVYFYTYIYPYVYICTFIWLQKRTLHCSLLVTELDLSEIDVTKMVNQHKARPWFTASTRALVVVEDREYQERMRIVWDDASAPLPPICTYICTYVYIYIYKYINGFLSCLSSWQHLVCRRYSLDARR